MPRAPRQALPALRSVEVADQLRERIRYLRYSQRAEETYVYRVRTFIRFHELRHPAGLGGPDIERFSAWLVNERSVSGSTHRQAMWALLVFYGKVIGSDLPWMADIGRPRIHRRLPVVLSREEGTKTLTQQRRSFTSRATWGFQNSAVAYQLPRPVVGGDDDAASGTPIRSRSYLVQCRVYLLKVFQPTHAAANGAPSPASVGKEVRLVHLYLSTQRATDIVRCHEQH